MAAQIPYLISDTPDAVDIVGDLIATVLLEESANQIALAVLAGATQEEAEAIYKLRVFRERWAPWDIWNEVDNAFIAPVVDIWIEGENRDTSTGNSIETQKYNGNFNIDVYGYGRARGDGAGGQVAADKDANSERNRGRKWVRRYLTAAPNIYLRQQTLPAGERTVWNTSMGNFEYFVPAVENLPVPRVKAVRAQFTVGYNELSPQIDGEPLVLTAVDICTVDPNTQEAFLAAEVDTPYPLP